MEPQRMPKSLRRAAALVLTLSSASFVKKSTPTARAWNQIAQLDTTFLTMPIQPCARVMSATQKNVATRTRHALDLGAILELSQTSLRTSRAQTWAAVRKMSAALISQHARALISGLRRTALNMRAASHLTLEKVCAT